MREFLDPSHPDLKTSLYSAKTRQRGQTEANASSHDAHRAIRRPSDHPLGHDSRYGVTASIMRVAPSPYANNGSVAAIP